MIAVKVETIRQSFLSSDDYNKASFYEKILMVEKAIERLNELGKSWIQQYEESAKKLKETQKEHEELKKVVSQHEKEFRHLNDLKNTLILVRWEEEKKEK